jgi:hypothetical protein
MRTVADEGALFSRFRDRTAVTELSAGIEAKGKGELAGNGRLLA